MVFDNTFCKVIVHIGKWVVDSAMRTHDMNDAHDPYEHEEDAMGGNVRVVNVETESNGRRFQYTPPYFVATVRRLRVEMQSYREDNERLVKVQEEKN